MKALQAASPETEASPRAALRPAGREEGRDPEHEELVVVDGERSGARMAIAIHSTALGPALGGVRLWHYEDPDDATADALRLAEAMTLKAAAAGLDLGGGKGVICAPTPERPTGEERRAMLLDFGDLVESLGGRYVTAEDVGTGVEDMAVIRERTQYVTGRPPEEGGVGDPSPFTALGVEAAMRAAARVALGSPILADRRVVIVGVGHVGERLARSLRARGARLVLTDISPHGREVAAELEAEWMEPEEALRARCDVLAPCAVGGAIHEGNVRELRCRVVCGAANNQLASPGLADVLARRGILYAPDFIVNAGGLISVYRELRGYDEWRARSLTLGIEELLLEVLAQARRRRITPLAAARELAEARLAGRAG